ncbi:hypothetical protein [Methylomonas sp. TEB]|uniref:hypothetical protein n=1 Tax=Methylomonas sp. TEB TaxID=3398229 RepID=UPI0039F46A7F
MQLAVLFLAFNKNPATTRRQIIFKSITQYNIDLHHKSPAITNRNINSHSREPLINAVYQEKSMRKPLINIQ